MSLTSCTKSLTNKQKTFVAEYQVDLNATQAAIRAGYSKKTAQQAGSRMLLNVVISGVIKKAQDATAEKAGVTQQKVVDEFAKIAFFDLGDLNEAPSHLVAAKLKALDSLSKHTGGFSDKITHSSDGFRPIQVITNINGAPGSNLTYTSGDDDVEEED